MIARIVSRSSTNFSSQLCRMLSLEIASILPFHDDFSYEFHEDPDFVLTVVLEVAVELAWIAHTLFKYDQFPFAENQ